MGEGLRQDLLSGGWVGILDGGLGGSLCGRGEQEQSTSRRQEPGGELCVGLEIKLIRLKNRIKCV